jgi:glycyl-tRNA synthetase beta chain
MERELFLEIGVEELPASWLPGLNVQLVEKMRARLASLNVKFTGTIEAFSTPRRLAVVVPALSDRQEDRDEKVMGPPVSAAYDAEGHPTQALMGFARKNNIDIQALTQEETPKGKYFTFQKLHRGKATVDVAPELLNHMLRDLSFPKQMHWDAQLEDGKGELLFGRPIRWLLYLYGGRVVPFTISRQAIASSPRVQDVTTGPVTYGHRFLATSGRAGRAIKVRSFDEYKKKLAEQFVLISRAERRDRIRRELDGAARKMGGHVLIKGWPQAEALLDEVPDLVEYPAVVAGNFGPEFLGLPDEVLATTLIHHQHYFPVAGAQGKLLPAFLAVTNTQPVNDRAIAVNAERVVTARLRDARFFWDTDRSYTAGDKTGLEARLARLDTVLFHKALGSYWAKTERVMKLVKRIASGVGIQDAAGVELAVQAARLAKADLATDMVGEFPELQGAMGGIYAREAQLPGKVSKAIYYQYLPVALETDAAPSPAHLGEAGSTWAALALADRFDTIVGLFLAGERPTGSRDPFGLRRAAHGAFRVLLDGQAFTGAPVMLTIAELTNAAVEGFPDELRTKWAETQEPLRAFLRERLEHALVARGAAIANVRAVVRGRGIGELRPHAAETMVRDLVAVADTGAFRSLAEAFKRVRNIARELKSDAPIDLAALRGRLKEPAEVALLDEIERRGPAIDRAVAAGSGYQAAYTEAAGFEPAVARFFKEIFVMADEPALREARLQLMKKLETLILQLGDISEIVSTES